MNIRAIFVTTAIALASSATLAAAPQLRLTATALGPLTVTAGQNGPSQSVGAANIGDGTLSLQLSSSVPWLAASVGAAQSCAQYKTCNPVNIALQTSSLAVGTYTGTVTVADPAAIDAPQTITVTVQIGSAIPSTLQFYLAPGTSGSQALSTGSGAKVTTTTPWLSVGQTGGGTYSFTIPYQVTATAAASMGANTYNGTIAVAGSAISTDNKTVNVTLNVTTSPIAQPGVTVLNLRLAENSIKETIPVNIANAGMGTLTVSGATATAASSGTWLTATNTANVVSIVADPTNLAPGAYTGTVTVASNAVNPVAIPVNLEIDAQAAPVANFEGVVNNATFVPGQSVAPGDIMAIFGDQFIYSTPLYAGATPLPNTLGTTSTVQVMVNGQPAPLYFASYGQIDFEMPNEIQAGQALVQVVRSGQAGNQIAVQVVKNQPRILPFAVGNYGIVQNATEGGFAVSTSAGTALGLQVVHPAKAGTDFLTIYAIGLGPVSPTVATGAAATATPLSNTTIPTIVTFSSGDPFSPLVNEPASFSGLAPSFVGLYQVNVQVPANAPKGNSVPMFLTAGGVTSNIVNIAIQ